MSQLAKADKGKPRLTLVPTRIIYDIAEVRMYGCNKYPVGGENNWRNVEVQRYRDAAYRHFLAYIDDPGGVDSESGIKHRKHLECNLAFLAELEDGNEKSNSNNDFSDVSTNKSGICDRSKWSECKEEADNRE